MSTTNKNLQILTIIVLVAAVLMMVAVPYITAPMLEDVQVGATKRVSKMEAEGQMLQSKLIASVPSVLAWAYPMWAFLSVLGGAIIFIVARPFYNGERWARALILFCLAIPAVGGAFMFVPWTNFIGSVQGGISPAIPIALIGLIPYFAVLLTGEAGAKRKLILFLVFGLMGVVATYTFGNGGAAHRILLGHPKMPFYMEGIFVLQLTRMGGWLGVIILMGSIYFLYMRQLLGWYLAQIGAVFCMIVGLATGYWRHETVDYYTAGLLAAFLLVLLLTNKKELVEGRTAEQ